MKVNLVRRWGHQQPGTSVVVDDEQGDWLVNHNFAERSGQQGSASRGAAAPGTDGPDPIISGDQTRGFPKTVKGERSENQAWPAAGSPVQYNAGVAPQPAASGDQPAGRGKQAAGRGENTPAEKSGQ